MALCYIYTKTHIYKAPEPRAVGHCWSLSMDCELSSEWKMGRRWVGGYPWEWWSQGECGQPMGFFHSSHVWSQVGILPMRAIIYWSPTHGLQPRFPPRSTRILQVAIFSWNNRRWYKLYAVNTHLGEQTDKYSDLKITCTLHCISHIHRNGSFLHGTFAESKAPHHHHQSFEEQLWKLPGLSQEPQPNQGGIKTSIQKWGKVQDQLALYHPSDCQAALGRYMVVITESQKSSLSPSRPPACCTWEFVIILRVHYLMSRFLYDAITNSAKLVAKQPRCLSCFSNSGWFWTKLFILSFYPLIQNL